MPMIAKAWSVNGASVELGVDRGTLARRIEHHGIKPVGEGPGGVALYKLRDLFAALTGYCWDCGWAERKDDSARSFFAYFETDGRAERLIERLAAAPRERQLRALREHFAAMLWAAVAPDGSVEPAWAELPDRCFVESWKALAEGAQLEDVARLARGEWPSTWWGPINDSPPADFVGAFAEMQRERRSERKRGRA